MFDMKMVMSTAAGIVVGVLVLYALGFLLDATGVWGHRDGYRGTMMGEERMVDVDLEVAQ